MSLDRITNATNEQKARAFEWLRQRAIHGGQTWFHAAVLMEELHKLNSTPRPEGTRLSVVLMKECIEHRYFDQAIACTQDSYPTVAANLREWLGHARADIEERCKPQGERP